MLRAFREGAMTRSLPNIAALLAGLALAGCTETTKPFDLRPDDALRALRARGAPADGLPRMSTSVEVGERAIVTGNYVPLILSVTNNEHVPITVVNASCRLWYVAYDQHGTRVSGSCAGGYYIPDPITIQPRQSVEIRTYWLAASSYYDNGFVIVPLLPGPYRIQAYFEPDWPHPWDTYLSSPRVVHLVQ